MREKIHKFIDFIFDLPNDVQHFYHFKIHNSIVCYFRKPKYRVGEILSFYDYKKVLSFYKDYERDFIFYNFKDYSMPVSEGVLDFYNKDKK